MDIVDSFEKRIKSRFSHRQILFYEQSFELFTTNLDLVFGPMAMEYELFEHSKIVNLYRGLSTNEETFSILEE